MQQCNVLLKKKTKKVSLDASEDCIALLAGHCPAPPARLSQQGRSSPCWLHCLLPGTQQPARPGSALFTSHPWDGGSSRTGLAVNLLFFLFLKNKTKQTTTFALSKSPTYDYSARGLGTSEHYQHAVGGPSSPTNTSS